MKALIYLEEGKLAKGHNLKKLFDSMSCTDRKYCEKNFYEKTGGEHNLQESVISLTDIFVKWRYSFEADWTRQRIERNVRPSMIDLYMVILKELCESKMYGENAVDIDD